MRVTTFATGKPRHALYRLLAAALFIYQLIGEFILFKIGCLPLFELNWFNQVLSSLGRLSTLYVK